MHYGKNYSLQSLRSRSFISRSGVSMLGISNAAEEIGFRTLGYRLVNRKKKYSDFGKMKCSKFGNKSAVFLGTILQ